MIKINCLGDMCPIPILKLNKNIVQLNDGETVMIVSDHSCTRNSVESFCLVHQMQFRTTEVINGVWEIEIFKG